jgi:hypothetical protein
MTDTPPSAPPALPTVECPECGNVVPDAAFCGACGTHLAHLDPGVGARRQHAYVAFPDEGVFRLSVITSLFPQLGQRSRRPFRVAFGVIAVALVALALAGLEAPVIALCSVSLPLLFLLYVVEVDPYETGFVLPTLALIAIGAGLGVGWALVGGPIVSRALEPSLGFDLIAPRDIAAAVLVPLVGQLLMLVPVALLVFSRPLRQESLDGFTAGVTGALAFTAAATLTELAPRLANGNLAHQGFVPILTEAVVRGITVPLIAAATTGLIAAAWWTKRGDRLVMSGRWLSSPVLVLAISMAIQIGLGFADLARLEDPVLLLVHLAATAAALVVLRVGLHHVLLLEARDVQIGPPRACAHCHHMVPAMPFCPNCGVAERAVARAHRVAPARAGPDGTMLEAPQAGPVTAGPVTAGPVTAGPRAPSQSALFPNATPEALLSTSRLGHRRVIASLVAGLVVVSGLLVALAFIVPSPPPAPCTTLSCFTAPSTPVEQGIRYVSSKYGWTTRLFPPVGLDSTATPSDSQVEVEFSSPQDQANPANGTLWIAGAPAQFTNDAALVNALISGYAPNATLDYQVPGASIGYQPGLGEAFEDTPNSAFGDAQTYEVVVICSIRNNFAICALASGIRTDLNQPNEHPTLAKQEIATYADPDLNGVLWPGEPLP